MSFQFNVPDMTCGHCVSMITKAVKEAVPGATVATDLSAHRVTVDGAPDVEEVRQAIVDAGYEAQLA
ncbi:heavy-metal-associated domain-containing protein [Bordetella genomosp. 4]|uniref:Heavy metal transporter n=1 Tax=Bordetella genomosp. 4 TaxID=463044 RepID=A0A261U3J5_9BORD|nr:heavy-metal-associated domain-containing protein [Bordetella genomosp. 4]OZI49745.1 heavy metal transporter [Bordetella genomosp. 4]OZI56185.1 heavy metal transporter [Bordetella genomosp. 4]